MNARNVRGTPPLRRHRLVRLSAAGWKRVLGERRDDEASGCIGHWAAHGLPLVITRQAARSVSDELSVALGLSTPLAWSRRALVLRAPLADIGGFGEFPQLDEALHELPAGRRPGLRALAGALAAQGLRARVYGSVGWQHLTGLPYLHAASDLDLWIGVDTPAAADRAAAALAAYGPPGLRIDGELVLPDGNAVAWREWAAWRGGRCRGLLVKALHGSRIASRLDWDLGSASLPQRRALCA